MKKLLITTLLILSSVAVFASDLIIESKTQTFSDKEKKIKLDGGKDRNRPRDRLSEVRKEHHRTPHSQPHHR